MQLPSLVVRIIIGHFTGRTMDWQSVKLVCRQWNEVGGEVLRPTMLQDWQAWYSENVIATHSLPVPANIICDLARAAPVDYDDDCRVPRWAGLGALRRVLARDTSNITPDEWGWILGRCIFAGRLKEFMIIADYATGDMKKVMQAAASTFYKNLSEDEWRPLEQVEWSMTDEEYIKSFIEGDEISLLDLRDGATIYLLGQESTYDMVEHLFDHLGYRERQVGVVMASGLRPREWRWPVEKMVNWILERVRDGKGYNYESDDARIRLERIGHVEVDCPCWELGDSESCDCECHD